MFRDLSAGAIGINRPFEECLKLAQLGGFQGVDVNVAKLAESGPPEHWRQVLADHGLVAGIFSIPADFRQSDEELAENLKKVPALCRYARALGANRTATWIPSWSDDQLFQEHFNLMASRLRPICQALADEGCRYGLEFLGPKTLRAGHKYDFIHTPEGMRELCSAIGTGNVGLLLDSWHWYTADGTVEQLRKLTDADIVHVHINDAPPGIPIDEQVDQVRRIPGETGVIDLVGFLQALNEIGYTGPVAPEPFVPELGQLAPEDAARRVGMTLKGVWEKAGVG